MAKFLPACAITSSIQRATRTWPLPTWNHLWLLGSLTVVGLIIALAPTIPHDYWWHLKAGELIATQGIPHTNLFAWTLPREQPYVYGEWLAEWLMYLLFHLGGPATPVLVRNLLGMAAFSLVALQAHLRSSSVRLAALALALAGTTALNNLSTRPQIFSWLPFALFALLLTAYTAGHLRSPALLVLPITMALWVNLHGAFVLGLLLVTLVCAGETLRFLLKRPGALTRRRLLWLYTAALATLAATLLNPLGSGIFGYVLGVLNDPVSQTFIKEWQPPNLHSYGGICFFATLGLLPLAWLLSRRRPTLTDGLCAVVFVALGLRSDRYITWAGMLDGPLLAQCLAGVSLPWRSGTNQPTRRAKAANTTGRRARRRSASTRPSPAPQPAAPSARPALHSHGAATLRTLLALVLLLVLIAVQPPISLRLPIPGRTAQDYADVPGAPRMFARETPVAAVEYLRAHPLEGRLFNELGYGSYLIWALGPDVQVFIDTRIELFGLPLWQEYQAISAGRNDDQLLIDKYDVTRVLLSRRSQADLAAALEVDTEHWLLEYRDSEATLFRRR